MNTQKLQQIFFVHNFKKLGVYIFSYLYSTHCLFFGSSDHSMCSPDYKSIKPVFTTKPVTEDSFLAIPLKEMFFSILIKRMESICPLKMYISL